MPNAICHCGAVNIQVPRNPHSVTDCNCSICRRYGVLWAYYKAAEVVVVADDEATDRYCWGEKSIWFVRCHACGCVTHWKDVERNADNRIGVNARNFEPDLLKSLRVRRLDGASSWQYVDEDVEDV